MVKTFQQAAVEHGHQVKVFNVCKMNIKGCLACEYCHGKGHGQCVQKDDMQEIDGDFLGYLGLEGMGIFTNHDRNVMSRIKDMAASL